MFTKIKNIIIYTLTVILVLTMLSFFVKGAPGNPLAFQTQIDSKVGGPFESTNSTSRYVLTKSIVENGSVVLDEKLARRAAPDLVYYNGKFISIFTPGVSFAAIPFYYFGMLFNMPQFFTFLLTTIAAVINVFLIMAVSRKLGANTSAALLAGLIFLFATNALAYAFTLTQHHLSITVLLFAFLIAVSRITFLRSLAFGMLVGFGLLLDIPNAMMLLPIGIYYALRHISLIRLNEKIKVAFNLRLLLIIFGLIPFISILAQYNYHTTGSYTLIGQNIGRTNYFDTIDKKQKDSAGKLERSKSTAHQSSLPFRSRRQLSSLNVLLISNERAWIFYSPVLFMGIMGLIYLYRRKETQVLSIVAISVIAVNIVMYGMFTDPWGGWSFGARYLLPGAAFLCAALGVALTVYIRKLIFAIPFLISLIYSITISVAGALTTAAIPPKIEAVALAKPIPYTYDYNFQLLELNTSSSLIFNLLASQHLSAEQYFNILALTIISLLLTYSCILFYKTKSKRANV